MKMVILLPAFLSVTRYNVSSLLSGGHFTSSRTFLTGTLCAQASPSNYFLLKSEPDEFSIEDLQKCKEDEWDGVRNFQARNKMRLMKKGDLAFFYHSSCKVPSVVGTMSVVREAAPDVTALDLNHKGYDSKSTPENCRWDAVRVKFESILDKPVPLKLLKEISQEDDIIADMTLLRQSRLSVHEITKDQWDIIMAMAVQTEEDDESSAAATNVKQPPKKRTRRSSS
jgi:predicted RNA-binding protein with PUA-like domain